MAEAPDPFWAASSSGFAAFDAELEAAGAPELCFFGCLAQFWAHLSATIATINPPARTTIAITVQTRVRRGMVGSSTGRAKSSSVVWPHKGQVVVSPVDSTGNSSSPWQ